MFKFNMRLIFCSYWRKLGLWVLQINVKHVWFGTRRQENIFIMPLYGMTPEHRKLLMLWSKKMEVIKITIGKKRDYPWPPIFRPSNSNGSWTMYPRSRRKSQAKTLRIFVSGPSIHGWSSYFIMGYS